ncbi:MAG: hypothetical protein M1820_006709 [Bogoriella megaspora]|nr:MAG: hypothetical protein M1820_006709 [Bogoriella megaspora]
MSQNSPPQQNDGPDSRNSLRHILAAEPEEETPKPSDADPKASQDEATQEAEDSIKPEMHARSQSPPAYTSTTQTTRRNANGSVSSVYSGNKIRHLKKEDGIPLWRKDIQFDFLRAVFEDTTPVFTRFSDGDKGHNFADIYLDAMAKSSKCSRILKDKLLTERSSALNMAMVCLLVNVGRMNTTLNCEKPPSYQGLQPLTAPQVFPEMRAQLRTYHSIPALQAHQDPNAYKQLQDAPRLKSILKGATEDTEQPSTIDDIKAASIPRTNPVNLIFVLSQYAPKISELHFFPPRDFFDLITRSALSSKSRANAFLWLMWWYLESDFSREAALKNPFGPGQEGDGTEGIPLKVPPFVCLTETDAEKENVDTQSEIDFGEQKKKERVDILATDPPNMSTGPRKGPKKGYNASSVFGMSDDGSPARDMTTPQPGMQGSFTSINRNKPGYAFQERNFPSDSERTRSPSPAGGATYAQPIPTSGMHINTLLNEDAPSPASRSGKPPKPPGPGRGNWRRNKNKDAPSSANTPGSERPYKPRNLDPNHPAVRLESGPSSRHDALAPAPSGSYFPPSQYPPGADPFYDSQLPYTNGTPTANHPPEPHLPDYIGTINPAFTPHAPPPLIPLPPNYVTLGSTSSGRGRSRPQTQHQLRVEQHRQQRVNYILDRKLRREYTRSSKRRVKEGGILRAWKRLAALPDGYNSAEEESGGVVGTLSRGLGVGGLANGGGVEGVMARMIGVGGLVPVGPGVREREDWGEGMDDLGRTMRRVGRRLERWEGPDLMRGVRKGRSGRKRGEGRDGERRGSTERGGRKGRGDGYSSPLGAVDEDDERDRDEEEMREGEEDGDDGDEDDERDLDDVDEDGSESEGEDGDGDDRMVVDG